MSTESRSISLVVLSHGLWGNKSHMSYIEKQIKAKYKNKVFILNSAVNEAKYTYDGVDICGKRLAKDIEYTVAQLEKKDIRVKKISMIGYSLGGLIVRFAIGVLGQKGFFDTIEPDYFVTFATPHIGVKVPSPSTFYRIFNFMSSKLVSRSGEQLQLIDVFDEKTGRPALEVMSDPGKLG
ncbi:putative serine esterase-domain-containing protein [Blakeslea trispora]|nr:putative serine esterase-domain-containing protein [Blakeslea trispora]